MRNSLIQLLKLIPLNRDRVGRFFAFVIVGAVLQACAQTAGPPSLTIWSLRPGLVDVVVNGSLVGTLKCGDEAAYLPGPQLPPLPWDISLRSGGGNDLYATRLDDGMGPKTVQVWSDTAAEFVGAGPTLSGFDPSVCDDASFSP